MNERDHGQKVAEHSGNTEDWKELKKLRNRINGILKKEKSCWQSRRLESCSSSSSDTVKNWLGRKTGGPPIQLVINVELKTEPKELADSMNSFFDNKVNDLRRKIPPSRKNHLDRRIPR